MAGNTEGIKYSELRNQSVVENTAGLLGEIRDPFQKNAVLQAIIVKYFQEIPDPSQRVALMDSAMIRLFDERTITATQCEELGQPVPVIFSSLTQTKSRDTDTSTSS